ncbi:DUF5679 domain-containing protein [Chloroflexota bacterium]
MKCKAQREMKDAKSVTIKSGRLVKQGLCLSYGAKMLIMGISLKQAFTYGAF